MYVWEIEFELLWDYMEGEWDDEVTETYRVAAPDYDSATEEAKMIALAETARDSDEGKDLFVKDARLVNVKRGLSLDGIARVKAK